MLWSGAAKSTAAMPARERRTATSSLRTTLQRYDMDSFDGDWPGVSVDLVADPALDDLSGPRLPLLRALFAKDRVKGLHRLSTPGQTEERIRVTLLNSEPCVVTIGRADAVKRASEALKILRKAALNDDRLVREVREPVCIDGLGAVAHNIIQSGAQPALSFADDALRAMDACRLGLTAVPDLRGGRDLWSRSSPLHAIALATAERSDLRLFPGRRGVASIMLTMVLDQLVQLLPKRAGLYPGEDELEAPEHEEAVRHAICDRCSPKLLALLTDFRAKGHKWKDHDADLATCLWALCDPKIINDAACAPLIACLERLRDAAAEDWPARCPSLPPWAASWSPLRVRAHGALHGDNILVDERWAGSDGTRWAEMSRDEPS